jgi:dolichol-phosphate mannosyltransferase
MKTSHIQLSVVVPVFNEAAGLQQFHSSLVAALAEITAPFEIVYCDDGSTDDTATLLAHLAHQDDRVRSVVLSRNFGKENALAAGIATARGQAVLMIDGDGQHPVERIADFVEAWKQGAQVVIGVRTDNSGEGWFKRVGSKYFYKLFNHLTKQELVPGSTDFRLIDRQVQQAFLELHETDRITRGLIDWLGFDRVYIPFVAKARQQGTASYSRRKLLSLAANSFVSLTSVPLYIFGYLGLGITAASFVLGATVFIEQVLLEDPLSWDFTGTAMLSIMLLFLVGVVLLSQGVLALYISHIHNQSKQRPLYVIDHKKSVGPENAAE